MCRRSASAGRTSTPSRPTARRSPTPATPTRAKPPAPTATCSLCPSPAERRSGSPPIPAATARRSIRRTASTSPIARSLRGGYESDRFRLMLYERATGKITDLTPNFDRWVDSMAWSPDSKTIYFTAGNEGENPIYALHVDADQPMAAGTGRRLQRQPHADARRQDAGVRHACRSRLPTRSTPRR